MKCHSKTKQLLYFIMGLIVIGCNSKNETKVEDRINHSPNPIREYSELKNSVYSVNDVINHKSIKVYGIKCPGECGVRSLFTKRNGKIVELERNKFKNLITTLNDPNTYGAVTSACYHPSVGIITYDEKENPLSYIGICLTCNNHESNIDLNIGAKVENDYKYGYSPKSRKLLRSFLSEIGFDESETFSSFDYKEDLIKYLEGKGMSKFEIQEEITNYK